MTAAQLNVILLGAPGAGKGTQAERIVAGFELPHISTGDMLRAAVAEGTELGLDGQEVHGRRRAGPRRGRDRRRPRAARASPTPPSGFLLDGFPRTHRAGRGARRHAGRRGRALTHVVLIDVPEDELVQRLAGRRTCAGCGKGYHVVFDPPEGGGRLRRLRRRALSSATTTTRRRCATASRCTARRPSRSSATTSEHGRAQRRVYGGGKLPGRGVRARSSSSLDGRLTRRDRPQVGSRGREDRRSRRGPRRLPRHAGRGGGARRDDRRARPPGGGVHPRARRRADLPRLPRLPGVDLRVAERHGGARHPRRVPGRARATS